MRILEILKTANEKLKRSQLHLKDEYIQKLAEELKELPIYRAIVKLENINPRLYVQSAKQTKLYQVIDSVNYSLIESIYHFGIFSRIYVYFDDDNFKIKDLIMVLEDWDFFEMAQALKSKYREQIDNP